MYLEIIEIGGDMVEEEKQYSKYFWKVDLKGFASAIRTSKPEKNKKQRNEDRAKSGRSQEAELKQLSVLSYILDNIRSKDNTFSLTYEEIANYTGVSKDTVVRIINLLGAKDFIRRKHNGTYMVNPRKMVWGRDDKRDTLAEIYDEAKQFGNMRKRREPNKKSQPESPDNQPCGDDSPSSSGSDDGAESHGDGTD